MLHAQCVCVLPKTDCNSTLNEQLNFYTANESKAMIISEGQCWHSNIILPLLESVTKVNISLDHGLKRCVNHAAHCLGEFVDITFAILINL